MSMRDPAPHLAQDPDTANYARMPDRALLVVMCDRAMAVFQQIGAILRAVADAKAAAARAQEVAERCERMLGRVELLLARRPASVPPPRSEPRRRLDSLIEVADDDPTQVRELKKHVASLVARDVVEDGIEARDEKRIKRIALYVSLAVGLCTLVAMCVGAWAWVLQHVH